VTVRQAQYLCAIIGALIVNCMMLTDSEGRGATFRDFLINFSSDIIAVGAVLLMTEAMVVVRYAAAPGTAQ
jgi:hypothetical protein